MTGIFYFCRKLTIPVRICALPLPVVSTHLIQIVSGFPTQQRQCHGRIGIIQGNVPRSSGRNFVWYRLVTRPFESMHHIQNAIPYSCAKIDSKSLFILEQIIQRIDMPRARSMT